MRVIKIARIRVRINRRLFSNGIDKSIFNFGPIKSNEKTLAFFHLYEDVMVTR